MSQPIYNKGRFPTLIKDGLCRGCHQPVPPNRKTWCSRECCHKYHPGFVKDALFARDKGVCSSCGVDTEKLKARLRRMPTSVNYHMNRFWRDGVFDRARYNLACKILLRRQVQLGKAIEKRRRKMFSAGWPTYACMKWWQMDHIIPFSEGGLTVLENVQTLCIQCHRAKSKKEARERADRKRLLKQGKPTDQLQTCKNKPGTSHIVRSPSA